MIVKDAQQEINTTMTEWVVEVEHTYYGNTVIEIDNIYNNVKMAKSQAQAWAAQGYRVWVVEREVTVTNSNEFHFGDPVE